MEVTSQPIRFSLSALVLVLMIGMFTLLPLQLTVLSMYIFGYTHYLLAIHYSKRGIAQAWSKKRSKWLLISILPLTFIPFLNESLIVPSLVIYFGIHHVMSEVYFDAKNHSKQLRTTHWWALIGSYFAITGHHVSWVANLSSIGWIVNIVATLAFLYVWRKEGTLAFKTMVYTCPWIIFGPAVALIGEYIYLDWRFLINWHFFFWLFIPYLRSGMFNRGQIRTYWKQNILLTALFSFLFFISLPTGNIDVIGWEPVGMKILTKFFLAWSFLHISWSFIISGGNPNWLKSWIASGR